jgi:hypothetical protein
MAPVDCLLFSFNGACTFGDDDVLCSRPAATRRCRFLPDSCLSFACYQDL